MEKIKVLFADDDYMICDAVEYVLANQGWLPLIAHNGSEAYRLYTEKHPDVVVLDVAMPVLSGIDVARKIREHETKTPIIFYTGVGNNKMMKEMLLTGVNQTLMKDYSSDLLIEMVRNSLKSLKPSNLICIADELELDVETDILYVNSNPYQLSRQQSILLCTLSKCMDDVVTIDELCNRMWGERGKLCAQQLRKRVSNLNAILRDKTKLNIYNSRGIGYSLRLEEP